MRISDWSSDVCSSDLRGVPGGRNDRTAMDAALTDTCGPAPDGPAVAREAGLRYVGDDGPGISRRKAGKGFSYRGPDGARIAERETLARIRSLAVPPAWTDVWICPHPRGHVQATGRDARRRKQYTYHPRWRAVRDAEEA